MSSSKKLTCKVTCARCLPINLRPPPPQGFFFGGGGVSNNFAGSDSGMIQSVKLLHNIWSPTEPPLTHCILRQYTYSHREGGRGGRVEPERRREEERGNRGEYRSQS
jgi:hypothetical protein